jgi:hypothetical protein
MIIAIMTTRIWCLKSPSNSSFANHPWLLRDLNPSSPGCILWSSNSLAYNSKGTILTPRVASMLRTRSTSTKVRTHSTSSRCTGTTNFSKCKKPTARSWNHQEALTSNSLFLIIPIEYGLWSTNKPLKEFQTRTLIYRQSMRIAWTTLSIRRNLLRLTLLRVFNVGESIKTIMLWVGTETRI